MKKRKRKSEENKARDFFKTEKRNKEEQRITDSLLSEVERECKREIMSD